MPQGNTDNRLHLTDLSIDHLLGISHLSVPRLGRVTLLAGRNGIGKTTILDAIRVYAAGGHPAVLAELLNNREEWTPSSGKDGDDVLLPDIISLFHGRTDFMYDSISIGSRNENNCLIINTSSFEEFKIAFKDKQQVLHWEKFLMNPGFSRSRMRRIQQSLFDEEYEWPPAIECESLGPDLPRNADMVQFWDRIALTDSESLPVQALQLILGNTVSRVAVIGDDGPRGRKTGRRFIVRLPDDPSPVPLTSLGDGAIRLFGVALALANSRNGFLVIDEAENGIHYSVQRDYWRMILQTAHKDNVQVVATTHSWDCVKGFAQAATEFKDAEGVLVRLERDDDGMRAIEYSEEELRVAAEQGIEVR